MEDEAPTLNAINLDEAILEQHNVIALPPLSPKYDEKDFRIVQILDDVANFCGKEFTDVPPNPDGEPNPDYDPDDPTSPEKVGGVPMPLDDTPTEAIEKPKPGDPDFVIDPDDPDKTGQIDPDIPGEKYPDGTGEESNPHLDKLREEYKEAKAKNLEEKESYWQLVWQVIRYLSAITCWTETADDTFILQQRTQVYSTTQEKRTCKMKCDPCDDAIVTIPIEYSPLQSTDEPKEKLDHYFFPKSINPFIGGRITVYVRGKRCEANLTSEYLLEHYDPQNDKVYIDRNDFPELFLVNGCCDCKRDVAVTLWYNAGYLTIPDGLLPLICPLIQKIEDSKMSGNECASIMNKVSGLLKRKKVGSVQYEWSDSDGALAQTEAMYVELFNLANMTEIYGISRCELLAVEEAGDVV